MLAAAVCIAAVMCAAFAACADKNWNDGSYDLSLPDFEKITANSSVSEDGWYLVFEDDFDKGDSANTDLQSAMLQVKQAQAALTSARLAFLPAFTLSPQGGITKMGSTPSYRTWQAPVSASWEADLFGNLLNASRDSKAALLQSEAYEQAVRSQVISNIASLYYTLLMLDRQLEISEATYTNWNQTLSMMKDMMEAGMTNRAGVAQTRPSAKRRTRCPPFWA